MKKQPDQIRLVLKTESDIDLDQEREAHLVAYRRQYWQKFKSKHKRVYGTLSNPDYCAIKIIAEHHGRSVWEQIWLESCSYRKQQFLPSLELQTRVETLYAELRRIGNNLNQIAKHHNRGHAVDPYFIETNNRLAELESAIAKFIANPVIRSSSQS